MSASAPPQAAGAEAVQSPRKLRIIPGCIVCKTCEFMAPGVFEVEEKSMQARVLVEQPTADQMAEVNDAIRNCPEHVIKYRRNYGD